MKGKIAISSVIVPIVLGFLITILGFSNIKGNISSVHWYHRTRITDENKLPFGQKIGLGTIIIGISIILFGCFSFVSVKTQIDIFMIVGSIVAVIGIVTGVDLSLYAMIKYNKGIF